MAPSPLLIPCTSHACLGEAVWDKDSFLGTRKTYSGQVPLLKLPYDLKGLAFIQEEKKLTSDKGQLVLVKQTIIIHLILF